MCNFDNTYVASTVGTLNRKEVDASDNMLFYHHSMLALYTSDTLSSPAVMMRFPPP